MGSDYSSAISSSLFLFLFIPNLGTIGTLLIVLLYSRSVYFAKETYSSVMLQNCLSFHTVFSATRGHCVPNSLPTMDFRLSLKICHNMPLWDSISYRNKRNMCQTGECVISKGSMFCNTVWEE